jgi:hypothetical protein
MRDDGTPENQHYVPKLLLRNFCFGSKEQLYVYDKWERRSFVANIGRIACERDFNVVGQAPERVNLEPFLTFVETDAKTVIDKILRNRNLRALTSKDKLVLAVFVASQYLRTRHTREGLRAMNAAMAAHIRRMGFDPAQVQDFKEFDEADLKAVSLATLQSTPEFAKLILHKEWILLDASTLADDCFYISDNPIGFRNETDFSPYGNLGFAVPGIQIYCPLSPSLTLAMFCHTIFGEAHFVIDTNNHAQLFAAIGATAEIRAEAAASVKRFDRMIERNPGMKSSIEFLMKSKSGEPIHQSEENIEFVNYLQVRFSHRHIYSSYNEFTLVEKILKDHPDWKMGLMPRMD